MAKTATTPRELEAQILTKAANQFQNVLDDWDGRKRNLRAYLRYNQKLWTIFVANATNPESDLPENLRSNIANLGIFVFKRTQELLLSPEQKKLEILITINRELSAGLRT